jgi:HPr kinase/phosphorylase
MSPPPPPEPLARWAASRDGSNLWLNASAVAVDRAGLLILGAPGAGKSSLALDLIALGASLIADDGLWLRDAPDGPILARPDSSQDLIEVRGLGLLRPGPVTRSAPLTVAVDLDRAEPERLPPRRLVAMGMEVRPLILGAGQRTLAPSLLVLARHGRAEP